MNSGTWLLILALLELDVRPGVKGLFPGWFAAASLRAKYLLYAVIVGAAVYWGIFGTFLDFWDACLWIAAFIFIERNVFEWGTGTGDRGARIMTGGNEVIPVCVRSFADRIRGCFFGVLLAGPPLVILAVFSGDPGFGNYVE